MMRALLFLPLAIAAASALPAFACGPVDAPPASPIPINACPTFSCANYTQTVPIPSCSGGVCISSGQIDPVLVIDIPESNFFAPSQSIAIAYSDLVNDRYHARSPLTTNCKAPSCAVLPLLTQASGAYIASASVQTSVQRFLQVKDAGTVPAHTTFRPLWPPAAVGPYVDAPNAGIPLLPVSARAGASPTPGPGNTAGIGWVTTLLPGVYERTVSPDAPFDDAFPPVIDVVSVTAGDTTAFATLADVDAKDQLETVRGLRVTRAGADASLEGWTVYLRDLVTQRRISEIVTLHGNGGATTFRLNTIGYPGPLSGTQPVIAPPATSEAIPTFVDNVIVGSLAADPPISNPRVYPALPEPVFVSGNVQALSNADASTSSAAFEAELLIREATTESGGGLILTAEPSAAQPFLHYSVNLATDGGRYAAFLPPGTFDVVVIPSEESGLSITQAKLDVATDPHVQKGKNLQVAARTKVSGVALVDDGRPLAGADVEAAPSVALVGVLDPARWPRPVHTTTAEDGSFSMRVDQGTFDIVVRPADGSRLPWTVRSGLSVAGDPIRLDPIRVLAPIGFDLTLHAPDDFSPIVRAVVRAYAFPPRQEPGRGGASPGPAAIEIGRWITGFDGRFRMFVSAPQ